MPYWVSAPGRWQESVQGCECQQPDFDTYPDIMRRKAHGSLVDSLKVENFNRENPSAEFPRFTPLAASECTHLRGAIAKRLGLDAQSEPLVVLNTLCATARSITSVDAEDGFDLRTLISELRLKTRAEVLVNWYRFDNIDRIALSDLSSHFNDIWYPSSDDIEIFDESLDWFVLIRHDGRVSALNLSAQHSSR